jgi:hypothetical protein
MTIPYLWYSVQVADSISEIDERLRALWFVRVAGHAARSSERITYTPSRQSHLPPLE